MAKKRIERLKAADAINRLDKMIPLIIRDVEIAIQVEAALETANALVMGDDLRDIKFYGADSFNIAQLSMSNFLALVLAKLFETPGQRWGLSKPSRYNRSDVASIPLMMRLLKQKRCRKRLLDRALQWTPQLRHSGELHAKSVDRAINKAVDIYTNLRRTHAGRSAMAKLKLFRDKVIAHTLFGVALASTPTYRELFLLMDVARAVAEQARLAIEGIHVDLQETEAEQASVARAFWRPALIAAATHAKWDEIE